MSDLSLDRSGCYVVAVRSWDGSLGVRMHGMGLWLLVSRHRNCARGGAAIRGGAVLDDSPAFVAVILCAVIVM